MGVLGWNYRADVRYFVIPRYLGLTNLVQCPGSLLHSVLLGLPGPTAYANYRQPNLYHRRASIYNLQVEMGHSYSHHSRERCRLCYLDPISYCSPCQ
jgi:hypothetical protein